MPKTAIFPPGSGTTLAPYSPGTSADGIVYVSGTLALDKEFNVVHVGDAAKQTEFVLETDQGGDRERPAAPWPTSPSTTSSSPTGPTTAR